MTQFQHQYLNPTECNRKQIKEAINYILPNLLLPCSSSCIWLLAFLPLHCLNCCCAEQKQLQLHLRAGRISATAGRTLMGLSKLN